MLIRAGSRAGLQRAARAYSPWHGEIHICMLSLVRKVWNQLKRLTSKAVPAVLDSTMTHSIPLNEDRLFSANEMSDTTDRMAFIYLFPSSFWLLELISQLPCKWRCFSSRRLVVLMLIMKEWWLMSCVMWPSRLLFFFICHRHINQRRQSAAWALLSIPRATGACQK